MPRRTPPPASRNPAHTESPTIDDATHFSLSLLSRTNTSSARGSPINFGDLLRVALKMTVRTVKVSNISLTASERDIKEFFSFSGDIDYVEMQSESERSQLAYVTFKDPEGAETAMLLSGATIVNLSVSIEPAENYQLQPEAHKQILVSTSPQPVESAVAKAEDIVSGMLAKGYVLGKDALKKAKAFDEQHHLISNTSATMSSLDRAFGLSEKFGIAVAMVGVKVREVDERYQVSELTRSTFAATEQKASGASAALMSNQYVSAGASWVSTALGAMAKAAGDVGVMAKEKAELAEATKGVASEFVQPRLGHPAADRPLDLPVSPLSPLSEEQMLSAI